MMSKKTSKNGERCGIRFISTKTKMGRRNLRSPKLGGTKWGRLVGVPPPSGIRSSKKSESEKDVGIGGVYFKGSTNHVTAIYESDGMGGARV